MRLLFILMLALATSCATAPASACGGTANGVFDEPSWRDASWRDIGDGVKVAIVETAAEVCIGVDTRAAGYRYVDVFIEDAAGALHNLHASMQVGERALPAPGWSDRDPETHWGRTTDWRANFVSRRPGARPDQPLSETLTPYDGYEFVVARASRPVPWRLRVEVRDFEGQRADVVWPEASSRDNPERWATQR